MGGKFVHSTLATVAIHTWLIPRGSNTCFSVSMQKTNSCINQPRSDLGICQKQWHTMYHPTKGGLSALGDTPVTSL